MDANPAQAIGGQTDGYRLIGVGICMVSTRRRGTQMAGLDDDAAQGKDIPPALDVVHSVDQGALVENDAVPVADDGAAG